jgi:hypothetical protein
LFRVSPTTAAIPFASHKLGKEEVLRVARWVTLVDVKDKLYQELQEDQ